MPEFAISSDLSGPALDHVRSLWACLEREFGLVKAQAARAPHLTFVVGSAPGAAALAAAAAEAARRLAPLPLDVQGLRVFPGERPVVYLAVRETARLRAAAAGARTLARRSGLDLWEHYRAASWVPHVTLALQDLEEARLAEVLRFLEARVAPLSTRLERLDVVRVTHPLHEYLASFPLSGGTRGRRETGAHGQ